jgi:hypothetical protein
MRGPQDRYFSFIEIPLKMVLFDCK